MDKIASFTVNHLTLEPGVYVSRVDADPVTGAVVTTFDLRLTAPNREPVMDTAAVHAIEHLGATYLRNDPTWRDRVVYFGPMGCRTGFYLILFGKHSSDEVAPLVRKTFEFVRDFEGEIPGARPEECGNWHDADLMQARWWARRYVESTLQNIDEAHLVRREEHDAQNPDEFRGAADGNAVHRHLLFAVFLNLQDDGVCAEFLFQHHFHAGFFLAEFYCFLVFCRPRGCGERKHIHAFENVGFPRPVFSAYHIYAAVECQDGS